VKISAMEDVKRGWRVVLEREGVFGEIVRSKRGLMKIF
jgi:hypothetical protein